MCWKLFLPHFRVAGCTKYSLEALRLLMQANAVLSPNLAHQVKWHRFVNTKGGAGRNIPCDLYNEHVNKIIKFMTQNMGSNLTEASLQRAVRCLSPLEAFCTKFDTEGGVPGVSSAHCTKSDIKDIKSVVQVVLKHKLLKQIENRKHHSFPNMHLNPLHKWDKKLTQSWIELKKKEYIKYKGKFSVETESEDSE